MNHFPKLLSSQIGFDVAQTLLENFDRHYRIFRDAAVKAKTLYEQGDWHGLQRLARERITSYDDRVKECVEVLEDEYDAENIDDEVWQQIKLHYIGLPMGTRLEGSGASIGSRTSVQPTVTSVGP